jgi:hypothetical protein
MVPLFSDCGIALAANDGARASLLFDIDILRRDR